MDEWMSDEAPVGPIVVFGRCGDGFLSVHASVAATTDHLLGHGPLDDSGDRDGPAVADMVFYDGHARRLAVDRSDGFDLVVADHRSREGELRARVDEVFAHARHRCHLDARLAENLEVRGPEEVRPPPDWLDLGDYLDDLLQRFDVRPDEYHHRASWWHNLFHRM